MISVSGTNIIPDILVLKSHLYNLFHLGGRLTFALVSCLKLPMVNIRQVTQEVAISYTAMHYQDQDKTTEKGQLF
jgi:hypothetical protein